jgi:hypothetical protein
MRDPLSDMPTLQLTRLPPQSRRSGRNAHYDWRGLVNFFPTTTEKPNKKATGFFVVTL